MQAAFFVQKIDKIRQIAIIKDMEKKDNICLHAGHRHRMIEKLDKEALNEHELLETLLFNAIPRKNTNELAHRLLFSFGSLYKVLTAKVEELKNVEGVGESVASYLVCIGKFYKKFKLDEAKELCPKYFERESFKEYLVGLYQGCKKEYLDFFLLDGEKKIIFSRRFEMNDENKVRINTVSFLKMVNDFSPVGIIMAHNHPYGTCFPSSFDNEATGKVQVLCQVYGVTLCDHFIYAPNAVYSYYKQNELTSTLEEYLTSFRKNHRLDAVTNADLIAGFDGDLCDLTFGNQ